MNKSWRPDNWDVIEIIKELRRHLPDNRMPTLTETLEGGADALLKAQRVEGFHITVGTIIKVEGHDIKATKNHTLILIPDEEDAHNDIP